MTLLSMLGKRMMRLRRSKTLDVEGQIVNALTGIDTSSKTIMLGSYSLSTRYGSNRVYITNNLGQYVCFFYPTNISDIKKDLPLYAKYIINVLSNEPLLSAFKRRFGSCMVVNMARLKKATDGGRKTRGGKA